MELFFDSFVMFIVIMIIFYYFVYDKHNSPSIGLLNDIIDCVPEDTPVETLPVLLEVYRQTDVKRIKQEVLGLFEHIGSEELSGFLVKELGSCEEDLLISLLNTLGRCGSIDAVESIYKTGTKSPDPIVRTAAGNAICAIQSRLHTLV
ncbi:MAG: hypothetical protein GY754_01595 [bacterium]|nr:hypothetical protein [bacterium]